MMKILISLGSDKLDKSDSSQIINQRLVVNLSTVSESYGN